MKQPQFDLKTFNQNLMPKVDEIKAKMQKLKSKYEFDEGEFGFPEITMEEIIKGNQD